MRYLVYVEEFYVEADNEAEAKDEAITILSWTGHADVRVQPVAEK